MGIMDRRPARRPAPTTPVAAQPAPAPAPAPSGNATGAKSGESSSGTGVPVTVVEGGPLPGAESVTIVTASGQPEKAEAATPEPDPRRENALRDIATAEAAASGKFFGTSRLELARLRGDMAAVITTTGTFSREELVRAEKAREALEERIALRELVRVLATRTRIGESELFARYAAKRLNLPAVLAGVAANLPSAAEDCEGLVRELGDIDFSMCEDDVREAVAELVKTLRAKPSTPPPLPAPSASTSAPAKPVGSVTQVFATMDASAAATTAPKPAQPIAPAQPKAVVATRHDTPVMTGPSANDLVQAHKALAESTAAELRTAVNGDAKIYFARRNPDAIEQLNTARDAARKAGVTITDGDRMMHDIVVQSLLRLNYCCRVLQGADDLLKRAHALGDKGIHEVEDELIRTESLLEGLLSSKDDKERLPPDAPRALAKTKDLLAETRRNLDFIERSKRGATAGAATTSDPPDPSDRATPVPPVVTGPFVTPWTWDDRARAEKDADAIIGAGVAKIALPLFHNASEEEYKRIRDKSRELADDARKAEAAVLPFVADKCRDASEILLFSENLARLMQGTSEHIRDRKVSDWREAVKNRCDRIETSIAHDRSDEGNAIRKLVGEWRAQAERVSVIAPQPAPVFEPADAGKKRRTRLAVLAAAILAVVTGIVLGMVWKSSGETPITPPTVEAPAPAPSVEPPSGVAPAPAPAPGPAPPPPPPPPAAPLPAAAPAPPPAPAPTQPSCRPYTSADVGGAPLAAVPQDMLSLQQLTMPCARAAADGSTYNLSACQVCTP